ncbi:hypothetical protein SeMB42_g06616 [Synchytrium endobioticum]|uniref:Ubiquitin-like domain-containing protein n=1 Tax=Synchytrium endobioticum TaxID=286115 RepID=A0A507CGQ6_9FUNG|nr:hypothetical protein SeMB42_g06616 [Synchytrium endobioticum]TPX39393.1 hypothetical protein SeLEV6574_g07244 [Synchytrium endobioticum]
MPPAPPIDTATASMDMPVATEPGVETEGRPSLEEIQIPFTVAFRDQTWCMSLPGCASIADIKKSVEEMSEIPVALQKLLYKGMLRDTQTLAEAKITDNARIILMASKLDEITSIAAAGSANPTPKKEGILAVVVTPLCDLAEHKKHIERRPDDLEEGMLNKRMPIPARGITNLYDQRGAKTRLVFFPGTDELSIATKERTQKFPLSSVQSVKSEPIKNFPEYHILTLQLGPTEKSNRYLYWFPAQYVEAIKEAILGRQQATIIVDSLKMTTNEVIGVNSESKTNRKKAKKLAKKEASAISLDAAVPSTMDAAGDGPLNVEADDLPRKNQYAELIAKKLRTLKKKLTKIEVTEKQEKATLNADQIRMLEQKPEVLTAIKEYEDVMTHINRIEQEELKANVKRQADLARETQQQIDLAVAEVKRAAEQDIQSVLKLFYVFADAVSPDGRITAEQMYAIDYLRAIFFSHDDSTPSEYLSKTTLHITEALSRSQDMLTPDTSYDSVMDAIEILMTISPPVPAAEDQSLEAYSPQLEASNAPDVPSFVAAAEDEDLTANTADSSSGEVVVGMPPMQLGAGGVTVGNLNFFAPSEVIGEDPYQPPQDESKLPWSQAPVTEAVSLQLDGAVPGLSVWADDVTPSVVAGTGDQADLAVVEGYQPPPSSITFDGPAGEQQAHRERSRGGRGGFRGDRGYRGDRGNGHRGGYRGKGGHNGDEGAWQTAGSGGNYQNNGSHEARGGSRGGRGRGFRSNREDGAPRRWRERDSHNHSQISNNNEQIPQQ